MNKQQVIAGLAGFKTANTQVGSDTVAAFLENIKKVDPSLHAQLEAGSIGVTTDIKYDTSVLSSAPDFFTGSGVPKAHVSNVSNGKSNKPFMLLAVGVEYSTSATEGFGDFQAEEYEKAISGGELIIKRGEVETINKLPIGSGLAPGLVGSSDGTYGVHVLTHPKFIPAHVPFESRMQFSDTDIAALLAVDPTIHHAVRLVFYGITTVSNAQ